MRELHRLGYAQQLYREMGGFSNFAISFSVISVLTGAIQLFGYGLQFAGPVINTFGWPLVSVFVLCVAASMAELASAYPTAGGLYFWAHRLGGYRWAWITAWFNMIGQVAITAGINYAAAVYVIGAINRIGGTALPADTAATVAAMAALMVPQMLINILGIRLTAWLNDFSVWWHVGGVLVIAVLLALLGRHAQSFGFLLHAVETVRPANLAATFTVGPFTVDSLMLRLPALRELYAGGGLALAYARVGDRRDLCARRRSDRVRRALLRRGRDQHHGALPRLRDPDLSQPAQQAVPARRTDNGGPGTLEPRPLGRAAQCRHRGLGRLHQRAVLDSAQRAGRLVHAPVRRVHGRLLVGRRPPPLPRPAAEHGSGAPARRGAVGGGGGIDAALVGTPGCARLLCTPAAV